MKYLPQEPTLETNLIYYVVRASSDMVGGDFRPASD